jgi:hypothetical protein
VHLPGGRVDHGDPVPSSWAAAVTTWARATAWMASLPGAWSLSQPVHSTAAVVKPSPLRVVASEVAADSVVKSPVRTR